MCSAGCRAGSEVMQQRRAQTFTGDIIIYDAIIPDRQDSIYCCQNLSQAAAIATFPNAQYPVNQERALPSSADMTGFRVFHCIKGMRSLISKYEQNKIQSASGMVGMIDYIV